MKYFAYILAFTLLFSCSKKQIATENAKVNPVLTFISCQKKMLKVEGGKYRPFVGRESDSLIAVKSFLMDETAVTNAEYLEFFEEKSPMDQKQSFEAFGDSTYLHSWKNDYEIPADVSPDAPVTNVSWYAAKAYAKSVGKKITNGRRMEFAARASEKLKDATENPEFTAQILKLYQQKNGYKKPVKQHATNAWGIYDLYGTIWEWTEDFNSVMMTGESRKDNTVNETLFCAGASVTSSDLRNYAAFIRFAMRGSIKANYTINNLGFRCAKDLAEN